MAIPEANKVTNPGPGPSWFNPEWWKSGMGGYGGVLSSDGKTLVRPTLQGSWEKESAPAQWKYMSAALGMPTATDSNRVTPFETYLQNKLREEMALATMLGYAGGASNPTSTDTSGAGGYLGAINYSPEWAAARLAQSISGANPYSTAGGISNIGNYGFASTLPKKNAIDAIYDIGTYGTKEQTGEDSTSSSTGTNIANTVALAIADAAGTDNAAYRSALASKIKGMFDNYQMANSSGTSGGDTPYSNFYTYLVEKLGINPSAGYGASV